MPEYQIDEGWSSLGDDESKTPAKYLSENESINNIPGYNRFVFKLSIGQNKLPVYDTELMTKSFDISMVAGTLCRGSQRAVQ